MRSFSPSSSGRRTEQKSYSVSWTTVPEIRVSSSWTGRPRFTARANSQVASSQVRNSTPGGEAPGRLLPSSARRRTGAFTGPPHRQEPGLVLPTVLCGSTTYSGRGCLGSHGLNPGHALIVLIVGHDVTAL